MTSPGSGFHIYMNGIRDRIGPADDGEWAYRESLIRAEWEKCHPGETFEDFMHRARFSKEDKGLLRDWMAAAARRAGQRPHDGAAPPPRMAA